jgi:hypothetical protein
VILANVWNAIGGVGAGVATVAALVTIIVANGARKDAKTAHQEVMAEQRAASEAAHEAFAAEMAERNSALKSQIVLERIAQAERIGDLLVRVVDLAREEDREFGSMAPTPTGSYRSLPALLTRLSAAVVALQRLGGPPVKSASQIAASGGGEVPTRVLSGAVSALQELDAIVRNGDEFKLDGS